MSELNILISAFMTIPHYSTKPAFSPTFFILLSSKLVLPLVSQAGSLGAFDFFLTFQTTYPVYFSPYISLIPNGATTLID